MKTHYIYIVISSLFWSCTSSQIEDKEITTVKTNSASHSSDTTQQDSLFVPTSLDTIVEISSIDLNEHNQWLTQNNYWDTILSVNWVENERVIKKYPHSVLNYNDSTILVNGSPIQGLINDEYDLEAIKQTQYLYSSKTSSSGKFLAFIIDWDYSPLLRLLDIENRYSYEMGSMGPYLWVSWSPNDKFCIGTSSYEEIVELSVFDLEKMEKNSFEIEESISNDKSIYLDKESLLWISEDTFTMDVYLFCFHYWNENASEDCIELPFSAGWDELREIGDKTTYQFSCSSGTITLLDRDLD